MKMVLPEIKPEETYEKYLDRICPLYLHIWKDETDPKAFLTKEDLLITGAAELFDRKA